MFWLVEAMRYILKLFFDRREFIKTAAAAAAAGTLIPGTVLAGKKPVVVVVHGTAASAMLAAGMAKIGGFSAFVKPGKQATVKPNAAWASRPDQGGNTDPQLVGAIVRACKKAGASTVVLPENTITPHAKSFKISGIGAAAEAAGGELYQLDPSQHYRQVSLPGAKVLKSAEVAKDVLDTGCLINAPVAKSHGASVLTLSMKNWMGSVRDRKFWHQGQLHQCIADCSTLIKPDLIVVDATRIMVTGGPRGPGRVEKPGELILGTDPVAVDAYAATLFGKQPFDVPHIKIAHRMGIGCGDLDAVDVVRVEAG
jgi:uncharacterized protein (DUF362 family)